MQLMSAPDRDLVYEQNARQIEKMLFMLGYRPDLKGYAFTRDAILLLLEDRQLVFGITKSLYPEIARLNGTSTSVVERGIRHATALAWERTGANSLRAQFPEKFSRPTNKTVLSFLVHYFLDWRSSDTKQTPHLL